MIFFHGSRQTKSRNKRMFSFVYLLHSPDVCTSLIVTTDLDKAQASWWVEGVGLTLHRSTWKLKVGGVQGSVVAKRASCLFSYQRFFSTYWCFNNDSAHRRGPSKLGGLGPPGIQIGPCSNFSPPPRNIKQHQKENAHSLQVFRGSGQVRNVHMMSTLWCFYVTLTG